MAKNRTEVSVPDELVLSKIHTIRGHKVMLDSDLAELYGVSTKALKQQVKRNVESFPEDSRVPRSTSHRRHQFANRRIDPTGKCISLAHPALLLSQLPSGNFLSSRLG